VERNDALRFCHYCHFKQVSGTVARFCPLLIGRVTPTRTPTVCPPVRQHIGRKADRQETCKQGAAGGQADRPESLCLCADKRPRIAKVCERGA
jgi:hypothetical protein